ncbi:hypothetical protein KXY27_004532 [Salmonella enterica]|nr:hypothetical protein [Salmonella enterica]EHU5767730.1 hypothetical protein [Salmonella enterica]
MEDNKIYQWQETKDLIDSLVMSMLDLNDRVIALEELAAEYVAEQEQEKIVIHCKPPIDLEHWMLTGEYIEDVKG